MYQLYPGVWGTSEELRSARVGKSVARLRQSRLARQRRRFGKRIERAMTNVFGMPFHGNRFVGSLGEPGLDFCRMDQLLTVLGNTSLVLQLDWRSITMGELKGRLLELLWPPSVHWVVMHDGDTSYPAEVDQRVFDEFASEFL